MEVRVRLTANLAGFTDGPLLTLELADGATVGELLTHLGETRAGLAPALRSALPVMSGGHVKRDRVLVAGEELALLTPAAGG